RTILLSTHVLSEIEAVATRILILRRGRLVAASPVAELQARLAGARRVVVEPRAEEAARAAELFGRVPGVAGVAPGESGALIVTLAAGIAADDVREAIFRAAVAGSITLRELRLETPSLEEIFGRATADDGAPVA
ncbi:MAG TPA: ABC transporter ATP-binding protein, partial [Polyangia bacterium]|nr:ABC transporter ATP-binding protein [Polyangia bacterium]